MAKKVSKKSGINMDKLNQIRKDLDDTMVDVTVKEELCITSEDVVELAENMGDSLEDVDTLRDTMVDDMLEEMNKIDMMERVQQDYADDMEVESCRNELAQLEKESNLNILNTNIKGAIIFNKGKGVRGITGRQLKAILESYKRAIGFDMSDEQIRYMRTVTDVQAQSVIYVINEYIKFSRTKQIATA